MKRILLAAALATTVAAPLHVAHAQISAAIGKPLPSPDLAAGTVSVRVVAGSPSSPVKGTEVTLLINDTPQVARTDDAGRAFFKDLPAGAKLQAKVLDEDKKEITSEVFNLPDTGVRLMLSTRPWNPGGGAGMMGGQGGAMPNPRQMSGEPRPEDQDPPGTLTVRLSYDDFKDAPPVGVPVALVGYSADDSVKYMVASSDKDGRAQFSGLDRTGATAYFAMTLLPRGTGVDRLISTPAVLDPRVGVRMILSGEKRTSTDPNVDDLERLEKQENPPPAGKVRIALEGGVEGSAEVRLVDAESRSVLGRGHPELGNPNAQDIQLQARLDDKTQVPAGGLAVLVHGGGGAEDHPLANTSLQIMAADAPTKVLAEAQTGADGKAQITVPNAASYAQGFVATVTINGKPLNVSTQPLELAKAGMAIDVEAHWDIEGKPQVMFDLVPRPGQVVYAETSMHGYLYRSAPFQPLTDRGTRGTLFIFPRILFSFSLTSRIDDEYLAVNGRFEISNNSWVPFSGGPDGLLVPMPRGFTGGLIADKDQAGVAVEPHEGFRVIRPIPPGSTQFHAAFSLPVSSGKVNWSMDLPWGAFNSGMEIMQVPGMTVHTPPGVDGQTMNVPQGSFFVLPKIQILPKQAMVMSIEGLPAPAAWRVWVPRVVGVVVIVMLILGVTFALMRQKGPTNAARAARRQQLLDALVEMDRAGSKNETRREELLAELESLWDEGAA